MPAVEDIDEPQKADDFLGEAIRADDFLGPDPTIPKLINPEQPSERVSPKMPPELEEAMYDARLAKSDTGEFISNIPRGITETLQQAPGAVATPFTHMAGTTLPRLIEKVPGVLPAKRAIEKLPGGKYVTGAIEGVQEIGDSFASPLGVATMGISALPRAVQKVVSMSFAADMAKNLPEQAAALKQAFDSGDQKEAAKAFTGLVGNAVFAGLAAKHGLSSGEPPSGGPPGGGPAATMPESVAALEATNEQLRKTYATEARKVESGVPEERKRDDTGGAPPEAGPGGGLPPAAPVSPAPAGAPPAPIRPAAAVKPPEIHGVRFDKAVESPTKKLWQFTVQDNGPAHNAAFSVPQGSTPEVIKAKIAELVKARTAPEPDWQVTVQGDQGEVPGYVQIVDPRATETSKSPTVESLRGYGHEVPDFTKLPTGKYTWDEAVKKLAELSKKEVTPVEAKKEEGQAVLKPAKLTQAAVKTPDGQVHTGPHHPGIVERLGLKGFESRESRNTPMFGFVDENGKFHTRPEAAKIAEATGQKLEEFDVDESGQEQPHSNEIADPNKPGTPISKGKSKPFKPAPADVPHSPLVAVEGTGKIKLKSKFAGGGKDWYDEAYDQLQQLRPDLFSKIGSTPDEVADTLNGLGFKHVNPGNLFEVLLGNHKEQVALLSGKTAEGRADAFQKALSKNNAKPSAQRVSIDDLAIGDSFTIAGEKFTVTHIDLDREIVEVNDGKKFRVQEIPFSEVIPADPGSVVQKEAGTEFTPPEEPPKPASPKLGAGEKQGDVISSTQKEDFALTGEKGTDAERAAAEKAKAAADAAEAKRIQDEQQGGLPGFPAGPGAATRPDLVRGPDLPVESGNPDVYGIAERVRAERAKAGQVAEVPPGEGISAPDSVERGRALLQGGADPQKALADFEKTKKLSSDDMALVRAEGERLAMEARQIEQQFGTDSDEYRAAWDRLSAWDTRSKAMQTEWHKTGQAQQGETDIDTGSFTGLQREYRDQTGEDFSARQAEAAKTMAAKVKAAEDAAAAAQKKLFEAMKPKPLDPVLKRIVDRIGTTLHTQRDAALARIKARGPRLMAGLDPAELADYTVVGASHLFDGALESAKWIERMVESLGEAIRPHLDQIWTAANDHFDKTIDAAAGKQAPKVRKSLAPPAPKTPREAVWAKVKSYIEAGRDDFDDIRNKIATDLGMPVDQVTRLITESKPAKRLADDAWKKQQTARRIKEQAKRWLRNLSTPLYQRAITQIPRTMFSLKVGFHGTVALGTHAPMVAFQPNYWKIYAQNFGKMYRMVGGKAYYEQQVQNLLRRPNFIAARRAGLVNDPFQYEDFNSPQTSQYFGAITGMGNRGYSVLKMLRQDMFDQQWNQLPKTAQIQEVAKAIADGVNHATGVVKGKAPKGTHVLLFAPRLEASRVAWLAVDPIKAADTFVRWKTASEADKRFAINQVKEKATVLATMAGLLALNQGILSAVGSKQKVNFDDPMKGDFLKFKAAGMNFSYGNPMLTMARLPVRMYAIRKSSGGKLRNVVYPDEDVYSVLGEYGRSQLSPFAGLTTDLWFRSDWMRRQLPGSNRPMPARLRRQGVKPYTWPEYWSEEVLPIPAEEAAREVWKTGFGMTDEQVKSMRKAMATIAIMSATGARLSDDYEIKQ